MLGDTDASGVSVVDEDLGSSGVGMERCGYAADVVTVAEGEEGQDSDCGVLDGVQSSGEVELFGVDAAEGVSGGAEP